MQPLHWKKPRLIFPCSMTDWMADFVPDEWRDKMLAVMALTQQHTYLTLTKRAYLQKKYLSCIRVGGAVATQMLYLSRESTASTKWPLPNLWLGVSAEDQQRADERIPLLLQTPATLRWVSAEPLLGAIDVSPFVGRNLGQNIGIDWGVIGLESGAKARAGNIEWIRQLVKQFRAAKVPVFVKQLGAKPYLHKAQSVHIEKPGMKLHMESLEIKSTISLKDPKGGDISEWPKDLRVREYPKVKEAAHAGA
jgi:protein gp37